MSTYTVFGLIDQERRILTIAAVIDGDHDRYCAPPGDNQEERRWATVVEATGPYEAEAAAQREYAAIWAEVDAEDAAENAARPCSECHALISPDAEPFNDEHLVRCSLHPSALIDSE